jgi:hypothetical protein
MTQSAQNITFLDRMKRRFGKSPEKNISPEFTKEESQSNISIFQNLKSIKIELWNEIVFNNNVKLLDKDYSDDKEYNAEDLKVLNEKFTELYDDYFVKLDNPYAKSNLEESQEKVHLSAKIVILSECVKVLYCIRKNRSIIVDTVSLEQQIYDSIKLISKNVIFKPFNTIEENITIIQKLINSNQTTFERKYGKADEKETAINYSFERQIVDVEQVLGRAIDIEKTNVLKWIELINLATEISKKRQDGNKK